MRVNRICDDLWFKPCQIGRRSSRQCICAILFQLGVTVLALTLRPYYCILRRTFPTPLFRSQMHLIFEVPYLTRFLTNHVEILPMISHIWYLDAPMSTRPYFKFSNFRFFMPFSPPCPQLNVSCTRCNGFCTSKIFVGTFQYVKKMCEFI